MKKVVRLSENDIEGLVRKIMKENRLNEHVDNFVDMEFEKVMRSLESKNFSSSKLMKIGKKYNTLISTEEKKSFIEKLKELVSKKQLKENEFPRGGIVYGDMTELVDDVINRIKEYGDEYIEQLQTLNSGFPSTKYKRIEPERNIVHSPGVKVKSTVYPNR